MCKLASRSLISKHCANSLQLSPRKGFFFCLCVLFCFFFIASSLTERWKLGVYWRKLYSGCCQVSLHVSLKSLCKRGGWKRFAANLNRTLVKLLWLPNPSPRSSPVYFKWLVFISHRHESFCHYPHSNHKSHNPSLPCPLSEGVPLRSQMPGPSGLVRTPWEDSLWRCTTPPLPAILACTLVATVL